VEINYVNIKKKDVKIATLIFKKNVFIIKDLNIVKYANQIHIKRNSKELEIFTNIIFYLN